MHIKLVFGMRPRFVYANERVRADSGRKAVEYGPLVMCAEQADNGGELFSVEIPSLEMPSSAAAKTSKYLCPPFVCGRKALFTATPRRKGSPLRSHSFPTTAGQTGAKTTCRYGFCKFAVSVCHCPANVSPFWQMTFWRLRHRNAAFVSQRTAHTQANERGGCEVFANGAVNCVAFEDSITGFEAAFNLPNNSAAIFRSNALRSVSRKTLDIFCSLLWQRAKLFLKTAEKGQ